MNLDGVVVLGSWTARTQSYLQALAAASMTPANVLFFGDSGRLKLAQPSLPPIHGVGKDLFMPDLSLPPDHTCRQANWVMEKIEAGDVNDPSVREALEKLNPKLIVYSGYGGQIVGAEVLNSLPPFLHMHAGWLPDERGSTTTYYGILRARRCGVSAILLSPEIDTGTIADQERYPVPPAGFDIDRLYDNMIRADLLVRVMRNYALSGSLGNLKKQDVTAGTTYYVIHPVLKHIALLSCPKVEE